MCLKKCTLPRQQIWFSEELYLRLRHPNNLIKFNLNDTCKNISKKNIEISSEICIQIILISLRPNKSKYCFWSAVHILEFITYSNLVFLSFTVRRNLFSNMLGVFVIFHFLEGNFEDIGVATSFLISVDFFDLKKIKRVSTEIVYTNAIADQCYSA